MFAKTSLNTHFIDFDNNDDIIAIKLQTSLGPIIIATSYTPPRYLSLPTIELNHIFNLNLPTIIISDFNAKHPIFDNAKYSNNKGKQLFTLMSARKLHFLGPTFDTYRQGTARGKPDLIICNDQFKLFHHMSIEGDPIGSDHIPIIFKVQIKPLVILCNNKVNLKKMNIDKYKSVLTDNKYNSLDGKHFTEIDNTLARIEKDIHDATTKSCPTSNTKLIKQYCPTNDIVAKIKLLQQYYTSSYINNIPRTYVINNLKNTIIWEIKQSNSKEWKQLVQLATECYGDLSKFWRKI